MFGTIVPIAGALPTPSSAPVAGFKACRLAVAHGFTLPGHAAAYKSGAFARDHLSVKKFDACSRLSYCGCWFVKRKP